MTGREDLLRVICLAFRNGLVVKKIRLRPWGRFFEDDSQREYTRIHEISLVWKMNDAVTELSHSAVPLAQDVSIVTSLLSSLSPFPVYYILNGTQT